VSEVPFKSRGIDWIAVFTVDPKLINKRQDGLCNYDDHAISIRRTLKGRQAIGTLIHEFAHAFFPDAREGVIEAFESELTQLLDDCGMIDDEWSVDEIK